MSDEVHVRPRRPDDLPALAALLAEQQPATEYPLRWPLPFPVEQFLVRTGERAAWVVEVGDAARSVDARTQVRDRDRFVPLRPGRTGRAHDLCPRVYEDLVAPPPAGRVAGHVAVSGPEPGDDLSEAVRALLGHGDFALVTVLFVGSERVGRGLGGLLLATATDWIRSRGLVPVLDVVPTHDRAVALYRARGWRELGSLRLPWLAADRPDLLVMALD